MKAEYKKVLDMLPTANSEEIKIMATALYHIIDSLEESIKSKDRTIVTLKETIDLLESQRTQREFEKVFKGKYIGEA